jgi:septal ring factor EnvC (AmiA/AmiB activator)
MKRISLNKVMAKLAEQPEKVELSKLENLKDKFLNEVKRHYSNRDKVGADFRSLAGELGRLENEAKDLENMLDAINKEAMNVAKQIKDLGVDAPQGLEDIGGKQIRVWSNSLADTFEMGDDIAKMLR